MVQMCYLKLMLDSTSPMPHLHFHTHNEETDLITQFCEDDEYDHVLIMNRKCEAINFGCRTQRKLQQMYYEKHQLLLIHFFSRQFEYPSYVLHALNISTMKKIL